MNDSVPETIHERMLAILAELPPIGKGQRNEQQGFMFRGHDDVLNALNPLLAKHGVFVVPDVLERVTGQRTTSRGSTMFEVNLHVKFRFFGAKGDFVEASGWGEGTDMGDKATSKAMTMAFKYVLAQAFAISTEEASDPDAETPEETVRGRVEPEPEPPREPATDEAVAALVELLTREGKAAQIEPTFERVRAGNGGILSREYVKVQTELAEARLAEKEAAAV